MKHPRLDTGSKIRYSKIGAILGNVAFAVLLPVFFFSVLYDVLDDWLSG